MSKEKSTKQIIAHKDKSIEILNDYLSDLIIRHPKKTDLISYWLHTYTNFLKYEESFDPKRNKSYERGDIVKIDFGFNIGSEHGGLHYAIVMDIHNNHSSPIITVIPLSSTDNKKNSNYDVDLGDELYQKLRAKMLGMKQSYKKQLEEINTFISAFEDVVNLIHSEGNSPERKKIESLLSELEERKSHSATLMTKRQEVNKMLAELNKMKSGSMALVPQIRCISKIRIIDPKNTHEVLSGIKLSSENMDKIDKNPNQLIIFHNKLLSDESHRDFFLLLVTNLLKLHAPKTESSQKCYHYL